MTKPPATIGGSSTSTSLGAALPAQPSASSTRSKVSGHAQKAEDGGIRKIFGFIAICLAMFVVMIDTTITNIALPDIMSAFHSTLNDSSWISTVYVLGVSVLIIPLTRIADQFGRKKVLIVGFALFGVGSALCGAAGSLPFLIAMRVLQSFGGAIVLPLAVPMGLVMFGKKRMQAVSGIVGATTAVAAAGGPAVGGLLIQWSGWRSIFYLNVPFIVVAVVLTLLCVDESYDDSASKKVDVLGIVLLASTLFLLTFALLKGKDFGWGSPAIMGMFAGSAVSLVAFVFVEIRVSAPMMDFRLFREMTFTSSAVAYCIGGFAIVSPALILNYFLQNVLAYTALNAALITMWSSATVIVSMPLGNLLVGKIGDARVVNVLGLLLLSLGLFLMAGIDMGTSKATMIADMVVMGFGLGFSAQAIITSVKHLPVEKSGMASGIVNSMRQIGTCLGIAILVSMLDANVATARANVERTSLDAVAQSTLAPSIKHMASEDIHTLISRSSGSASGGASATSTSQLRHDLGEGVSALQSTPAPADTTLQHLYQGTQTLDASAAKLADGQRTLAQGTTTLSQGLSGLASGSSALSQGIANAASGSATLNGGIEAYTSGVDKMSAGIATLNVNASGALDTLAQGSSSLDAGAQRLLAQMQPGSASNTTVRDGAAAVSAGSAALSQSISQYSSSSAGLYYTMIASNPNSPEMLRTYAAQLAKLRASCAHASGDALVACQGQLPALSNLVALYTAGTSGDVRNASDFVAALKQQAATSGQSNIVAAGGELNNATAALASGASALSSQFEPNGTFSQGLATLAQGAHKLNAGTAEVHNRLHTSIGTLSQGLNQLEQAGEGLKSGSSALSSGLLRLQDGSETLGEGLASAQEGGTSLAKGSTSAEQGSQALAEGTHQLVNGVGKAGQAKAVGTLFDSIVDDSDTQISGAFDKVFTAAAIVLAAASAIGLFTDRRESDQQR